MICMSHTLGITIYRPTGELKGCVEIIHGMQEHRTRYEKFAQYLKNNGYGVVTFDLPGHGETAENEVLGYFGDENGWDQLIWSAEKVAELTKKEFPGVPFFMMGHSMGTIVARTWMQEHEAPAGVILIGAPNYNPAAKAGMGLAMAVRAVKGPKGYSKMLDQLVTGNFNNGIENPRTGVDWLSYNEENVRNYLADPLNGFPFTVQGYIDELTGLIRMAEPARYLHADKNLPIAFFSGIDDPCTGGSEGLNDSIETLRKAGYENISCKVYEHMRHEILNETDAEKVYADILAWLNEKSA